MAEEYSNQNEQDEDADVIVSIDGLEDEDSPPEEILQYQDDDPNLAFAFSRTMKGQEAAKKIVSAAKTDFDQDWEASAHHRKRIAENMKMYSGHLPEKRWPYKNSANPHIPLSLQNLSRLQMRMFGELFGDWSSPFGVVPIGKEDEQVADVLSKHGNWQIRQQITDFKRQMARACLTFLHDGDVTGYSYWDPIRRRNCHDVMTCDTFVIPYVTSVEPDYSDLPHYSRIMKYYRHEISRMRGIWCGVEKVIKQKAPDVDSSDPDNPLLSSNAKIAKQELPSGGRHNPYKIIQYHGWFSPEELPGQIEDRFCKVIFDYQTNTMLHLSIMEENDWQDQIRYDQQIAELQNYKSQKLAYDNEINSKQERFDSNKGDLKAGTTSDWDKAKANADIMEMNREPEMTAPIAPYWMQDPNDDKEMPEQIRRVPIHMFSHGVCLEALEGPYGIGYGTILADQNRAANVALSQYSDAATLNNSWSIVTPSNVKFEGDHFEISPGKHNKATNLSGRELRDSIVEFRPGPPSASLVEIIRFMADSSESVTQAPGILSGESGKSGETYRGVAARIEQATKQLSVTTRRFADFIEQILKNNAKLNSMYLAEEEMVRVGSKVEDRSMPISVRREYYDRPYQVEFRSDLRYTSQAQKISEADQILGMATTFAFMANATSFQHKAMVNALKARGATDMISTIGPQPPDPMTPFGLGDPPIMPPMMPGAPGAPALGQGEPDQSGNPPPDDSGGDE